MFDLSAFRLPDMALCSTTVRRLGEGAASIEDAAGRITRYLYANLTTGPDDEPACVLVRLFKTHPYGRLSPDLQALVDARLGDKPANPGMKCLTLLGSTGAVAGWNDPALSSRFRVIPLDGPESLAQLPMFSQLFARLHIDLPFLENASSSLLLDQYATTFNVFYVPQALNSPYVPGQQDFVVPFGVQSVFGCGGLLPTGDLFALILFARVPVAKDTADLFKTIALSVKLAFAPFEHAQLILPATTAAPGAGHVPAPVTLTAWQDRVATLEAILTSQEQAIETQARRLEDTLADAIRDGQKLQKQSMRFETLSATSPIGIFETDAEGRCLYTNAAWQTTTGLTLGESLGDGWSQAIALEDRERIIHTWSDIAGQGGKFDGKFRMQRPDGTIRWVHARSRPLTNEAGLVTGHVGTTEDITERTQTDLAIHESERRFRQMANTVPVLIWIADQTKACTWFNDRWLAFTGRTLEQEYGNGWADGVHPEDYQRCLETYVTAFDRRQPFEMEYRLRHHDGQYRWLLDQGQPQYDDRGAFTGYIGGCTDIQNTRSATDALRETEERWTYAFEGSGDGVWDWNAITNTVFYSPRWKDILGYAQDEVGSGLEEWSSRIHPDDLPQALANIQRHLRGETATYINEHRMRCKDGSYKWTLDRGKVISRTADGAPLRVVGTHTDITARKQAQADLTEQATRLHAIVDHAIDGIITITEHGLIESFNPAAERLFGYTAGEMLGQNVKRLMPEPYQSEHDGYLANYRRTGEAKIIGVGREVVGRRKDGSVFPLELGVSKTVIGSWHLFTGTVRDLSDRKQREATRLRLQQAINHAQDGMALLDDTGNYTYMNPAHTAIYGYAVDELLGRSWKALYDPEWAALIEQFYLPILQADGQWQGAVIGKKKSGDAFHVDLSLALLEEPGTGRHTILSTCRDITHRKQMERDLIDAKDAAEAGAHAKAEFLATMSHEIRTPMNGVIGMTGLLLDTPLTPEQREYAETVRRSGEALLAIINDILDFSKIEAGKLTLEIIEFDLRTTVEETLDLLAEPAQRKDLEVVGLVDAAVPAVVQGDPGRLRQILTNLLGNAIKFTERGEVVLALSVLKASDRSVTLRFSVTDTGVGITPEGRARLFQSFSQVDGSTTRRFGGTGLGLAISKQLVELMRGEIGVDSQPGSGSTFWFTTELEQPSRGPASPTPAQDLAGLRVCLIDDNATNRVLLEHHADAWGMTYASAADGPAGLALIQDAHRSGHPFDLAIIDMQMPGMDGMRLAEAIHAATDATQPRLVLLTSLTRRGDAKLARARGFSAYLTKPIRQQQLYDSLRLVMGRAPAKTPQESPLITLHSLAEARARIDGRLLLAEDNVINQKVAVKMLEKLGCRVDVVADGREAVEALSRIPYALVFMDCQMPDMDGFEATRRIRQREGTAHHTPIIAMTANVMAGDRERCLAAGMDDYLSKPVHSAALADILARWVPAPGTPDDMAEGRVSRPASDETDAAPLGSPDGRTL